MDDRAADSSDEHYDLNKDQRLSRALRGDFFRLLDWAVTRVEEAFSDHDLAFDWFVKCQGETEEFGFRVYHFAPLVVPVDEEGREAGEPYTLEPTEEDADRVREELGTIQGASAALGIHPNHLVAFVRQARSRDIEEAKSPMIPDTLPDALGGFEEEEERWDIGLDAGGE
ncbi:MAG: hypothetical protein O7H41_21315 [Planctomycetota bacterium]|nr:hypothetical protein [Planctomycetota bacterium]